MARVLKLGLLLLQQQLLARERRCHGRVGTTATTRLGPVLMPRTGPESWRPGSPFCLLHDARCQVEVLSEFSGPLCASSLLGPLSPWSPGSPREPSPPGISLPRLPAQGAQGVVPGPRSLPQLSRAFLRSTRLVSPRFWLRQSFYPGPSSPLFSAPPCTGFCPAAAESCRGTGLKSSPPGGLSGPWSG